MADDRNEVWLGIRSRILLWLTATILPIIAIGAFATNVVENRLTDRVETELTNILRLEAGRIDREIDLLSIRTAHIADEVDGEMTTLTAERAATIVDKVTGNTTVLGALVVDEDGSPIAASEGARNDSVIIEPSPEPTFLSAYRSSPGDERLPVAAAIRNSDGGIVGTLILEYDLSPIVDLVVTHERFGDTSEAHIAQPTPDGDAAFITLLRFARDAAFTKVVPSEMGLPINQSLRSPQPTVVHSPDYRSEPSILAFQTLDRTGWGLVVKIDQSEALGVSRAIQNVLLYGLILTLVSIMFGWALVLRPLVRRIRQASEAAENIAAGNYDQPIDDTTTDEVGDMARSIDQLAADLQLDIARRSEAETRLLYQATHDQLTGVANRLHAEDQLHHLLDSDSDNDASLLFLDLDGFKLVNDTWGHAVGDEVLIEVAARLVSVTPESALVARWGGDEFVVVLPDGGSTQARAAMRAVRRAFATPFVTSLGEHTLHCSIGAATAHEATTPDELLHEADGRMFAEKQEDRRSRFVSAATTRLVEAALADNRIEAWLQPIVDLDESDDRVRIVGAEALVRIRDVDGSIVEPPGFLPELQESRFARQIDLRVAELAMAQLAAWTRAGIVDDSFLVSINLSPASLNHHRLCEELTSLCRRFATRATQFVLEISEDLAELNEALTSELSAAGFTLAIDDLGLKHSNIDRLTTSGATIAKIDRRFSADDAVLGGLFHTCSAKDVTLVAEGIETAAQATAVRDHGISLAQGFHFGRPQPGDMFEGMLVRQGQRLEAG